MPLYLKNTGKGEIAIQDGPVLSPGDDQLLIKVSYVAQNPTDWQQNELAPNIGSTVGYEFSGTVEKIGRKVQTTRFQIGDKVAGFTFGNCPFDHDLGAFGEYCIGLPHVTFKVPQWLSLDEAAGLPTALMVSAQALGQVLGYTWMEDRKQGPLLIWGAGSTMGAIAVQLAKLAGANPIVATAGTGRADYVKRLGADLVFDYNDPDIVKKIKESTNDSLTKGFDCAGNLSGSAKLTGDCLGPSGGTVAILNLPTGDERKDVEFKFTLTMTALGFGFTLLGMEIPENQPDTEYMTKFWEEVVQPLIDKGNIKPHTTQLVDGGLSGVRAGWEMMKEKKSYGRKLVYKVTQNS